MSFPGGPLQPTGLRHGIRHCPGGDDEMPCIDLGMGGRTYYVDPVNGLDTYDGRMPYFAGGLHGPWRTLTWAFTPLATPGTELGQAVAGQKGQYHDCLVLLPGEYEPLETWPLTIPAVKSSFHMLASAIGKYNGVTIGSFAPFHTLFPTLIVNADDITMEGLQIWGPDDDNPAIELNGLRAVVRRSRIWAKAGGGDGIHIPVTGAGYMSRIQHNYFEIMHATSIAINLEERGVDVIDNNIYAEAAAGIYCEATATYTRIFWNRIRSKTDHLTYGIKFHADAECCQVDENRIGRADTGVSGIEKRIWDLGSRNHFGRNYQMCVWDGVAVPLSAIPRAGDLITDGGVGSGYSRD